MGVAVLLVVGATVLAVGVPVLLTVGVAVLLVGGVTVLAGGVVVFLTVDMAVLLAVGVAVLLAVAVLDVRPAPLTATTLTLYVVPLSSPVRL